MLNGRWSLTPSALNSAHCAFRSGLTLARLATETGLSTALLSKLETDRMIPTLPTLATICRVYGVGMNYFFAEPSRHTISISRKAHLQGKGRGPEPVRITPLNAPWDRPRLVAQLIEFEPGAPTTAMGTYRETGGVVYVLEGKLKLDAGGMQEILEAGDCACMESDMPLAWSSADKYRCRVLAVLAGTPRAEG